MNRLCKSIIAIALVLVLSISPALAANNGTLSSNTTATMSVAGYMSTSKLNTLYIAGTFGGGTVTVEASPDGGTTWVAVQDKSYTTAVVINLGFRWTAIRIKLAGATSPAVTWWVL